MIKCNFDQFASIDLLVKEFGEDMSPEVMLTKRGNHYVLRISLWPLGMESIHVQEVFAGELLTHSKSSDMINTRFRYLIHELSEGLNERN